MSSLHCDFSAVTLGRREDCCSHFSDEESEAQSTGGGGAQPGQHCQRWGWSMSRVIWLLIHFSFGHARAASDFQVGRELL